MKKLVVILCMLGVLFGVDNKGLVKQGEEALENKDYETAIELLEKACTKKMVQDAEI